LGGFVSHDKFISGFTPHLASPLRGEGKGSKFSGERISILSDSSRLLNNVLMVFLDSFAIGFTPHLASPLRGEGKGSKFSGERISILSDFSRLLNNVLMVFLDSFAIGFTPLSGLYT
jgi:hypothetical protein